MEAFGGKESFPLRKTLLICLMILLLTVSAFPAQAEGFSAETVPLTDGEKLLRGYDADAGYVYVSFGRYPYEKNGAVRPCVWWVLAIENNYALLLNNYVVDAGPIHHEKKNQPTWKDHDIYTYLDTTMLETMFNDKEAAALQDRVEIGRLFILDNAALMNLDYGFRPIYTKVEKERECSATPWARAVKKAYSEGGTGKTWYWSRTHRDVSHQGYQCLIGYNGHISMGGYLRIGGIRPACYVDCSLLDGVSGSGTLEDPYVFDLSR